MISCINFKFELYKIYINLGLSKKQIWIRLKKLGFKSDLIKELKGLYEYELMMKGGKG